MVTKIQRRISKQHSTILGTAEKKSGDMCKICANGGEAENSENIRGGGEESFLCGFERDPKFCGEQGNRDGEEVMTT